MTDYEFRSITDKLGMEARDLAAHLGVPVQSLRQMRANPDSSAFRPPPPDWERVLSRLARQRALDLLKIANELNRIAG